MSQSSSSSPIWLYSYIKLQLFNRIRRFLRSKTARKRCMSSSDGFETSKPSKSSRGTSNEEEEVQVDEVMDRDDHMAIGSLQTAVKGLHFGSWEEKETAAKEIERLAKEDVKVKKLVAELGVIPVLVHMAASEVVDRRRLALVALIELANGTYTYVSLWNLI